MLFFTAVLLFIALLQRQHELTALCLVTIGIMAVAYFWSRASLRATEFALEVERSRLFPGEQLQLTLDVLNAKALPIHVNVSAGFSKPFGESRPEATHSQSSGLLGYQKATFHWHLLVSRRGVHSVGPLDLTTGDPFGFFPRQTQISTHHEIVVYPRLVPVKASAFSRREAFGVPGAQSHVRDPVLIQGTRDYQASEPARHIHWKASARHNRLQTKVFASSYQEKSMFLLDVSGFERQQDDADFERMLEVIASLAEQKDRQGSATGLLTNSVLQGSSTGILPPARNPYQISMIMETLARCTTTAGTDLLTQLSRSIQIPWGTSCAVFTLKNNSSADQVKTFLQRRRLPVKVFSCEEALDLRKQITWVDAGEEAAGDDRMVNVA
jgi:uncharacterized protein (DUF58 family)